MQHAASMQHAAATISQSIKQTNKESINQKTLVKNQRFLIALLLLFFK